MIEHSQIAVQIRQGQQASPSVGGESKRKLVKRCQILHRQRGDHLAQRGFVDCDTLHHASNDARIGKIEHQTIQARSPQTVQRQVLHFQVGLQAGMTVDLCAELQRLARRLRRLRPSVQHRPAVAQACHTLAIEQMGVDAGDRVLMMVVDQPVFFYAYFGLMKIGAVPCALNLRLSPADLAYTIADSGAASSAMTSSLAPPKIRLKKLCRTGRTESTRASGPNWDLSTESASFTERTMNR